MGKQTSGYTWDDERPTVTSSEWLTTLQFKASKVQESGHSRGARARRRRRRSLFKMLFLPSVLLIIFAAIAVHSIARLIQG